MKTVVVHNKFIKKIIDDSRTYTFNTTYFLVYFHYKIFDDTNYITRDYFDVVLEGSYKNAKYLYKNYLSTIREIEKYCTQRDFGKEFVKKFSQYLPKEFLEWFNS